MRKVSINNAKDGWRIKLLIGVQFLVTGLFIVRLFFIQVLDHQKYKAMAEEQYWAYQDIPAKRGDILSSDGYPLATTQVSYLLYGEPDKVSDKLQTANDIAFVLAKSRNIEKMADFEKIKSRFHELLNLQLKWVALEHYLTEDEKNQILEKKIVGLGFEEEPKRYYPEGTLASHVLGFVAKNEKGEEQGYYGIEGHLNGDLKGKSGKIIEQRDATGAPILVGGYTRVDSIEGRNVVLSINRAIQYLVEKKLQEGVKKYGAVSGSAIVMDPTTGDVLAMANFPTYDPVKFNDNEVSESTSEYKVQRVNLAISETYEPGSVIKPFTVAAGIDLGKVKPESTFNDEGPVYYSGYKIDNWDGKHHGVQTIVNLLQKSNNIGSAWLGHLLGSKNLSSYFKKFGFGEVTGVDLEGEETGIIRNYKEWRDIDLANNAFGQGISATPLQVLNAFSSIANDGELLRPRIIKKIFEGNKEISIPVKKVRSIISKSSAQTMNDMLIEAVAGGESKYFNLKGYDIAGKTGTAQISVAGGYDPSKTNATFVGYMATSKKFSMLVRLDRPSTSTYAAETAVPVWMSIADDLIKFFGLPPDKNI